MVYNSLCRSVSLDLTVDMDRFPRMNPELYGKKSSRMKLPPREHAKTIVPEDMKAVVKSMKQS